MDMTDTTVPPDASRSDVRGGGFWGWGGWGRDLLLLACGIALLFAFSLGRRALWEPDEGRYAEIPREMVASGDYVTPRLNGVKYFEKPPLFYWMEAGALRLLGAQEWELRLGPALSALLTSLAVYAAGRRLFGRRAGLLAAAVLATSLLWFGIGQVLTLDMPLAALLTAALLAFLLATREPEGSRRRRLLLWAFFAAAALATLAKGLIGLVIPGMVIAVWIALFRRWRLLRDAFLPSGILLFALIAVPWHLLVARANPEWAWFYFVHEHFLRYTTKIHQRYEPFWFFIPVLLAGLLPWTVFLPRAVRDALRAPEAERQETLYLLLWAGLVFLFFSFSGSKLVTYILPVFPPLALLLGRVLAAGLEPRGGRTAASALAAIGALFALPLLLAPLFHLDPRTAQTVALLGGFRVAIALAFLLLGGLPLGLVLTGRERSLPAGVTVAAAVLLTTLGVAVPAFDGQQSAKGVALALRGRLRPNDPMTEVAVYRDYFQTLPFYLGRRVTVAAWKGELEFGTGVEDVSGWMIDEAELARRWQGPRTVYLVRDPKRPAPPFFSSQPGRLLGQFGRLQLFVNH